MKTPLQLFVISYFCTFVTPSFGFELTSPVGCKLGETCFIQQYVDHARGPDSRDTFCGVRSYDGHKGTDFAVPDRRAMVRGIAVLAVADGVIRAVRDGMPDHGLTGETSVKGRECGNGVAITHEDGWTSQYCHMRKGSVSVQKGQTVSAGEEIGMVGMSGLAEFPHLHLQIAQRGAIVDPFDNTPMTTPCETEGRSLWSPKSAVSYQSGGIMSAGITDTPPDYDEVKRSSPSMPEFSLESAAMVFWAHFHGVETGDKMELLLLGPDGTEITQFTDTMTKNRATEMRYGGRKRRGEGWQIGRYVGTATLNRDGRVIATRTAETVVR